MIPPATRAAVIDDTLGSVRTSADHPAFPLPARPLIRDLADRVEERIP